jgi:diguanylate cyclase (GGDEF)-like protein
MAKPTGPHPSSEGAGYLFVSRPWPRAWEVLPASMRLIVSRALLPVVGYWSLLLALSLETNQQDGNWVLPVIVLIGLPLVALASIVLFRDAHASGSLLALRDDLTGVGNRRAFVTQSQILIRKARPGALGLILLDVDGLKGLNDSCGHPAGDELLEKVAKHIEARGKIYRIGGDEFAILVDRASGQHMTALMQALEPFVASFDSCGHAHEVRVSFGSSSNRENEKFQDLFRRADDNLIQHKRQVYNQGWVNERRGHPPAPMPAPSETEETQAATTPPSHLKLLG